jgi:hypothetical protein
MSKPVSAEAKIDAIADRMIAFASTPNIVAGSVLLRKWAKEIKDALKEK